MADLTNKVTLSGGGAAGNTEVSEKWVDLGDGTHARKIAAEMTAEVAGLSLEATQLLVKTAVEALAALISAGKIPVSLATAPSTPVTGTFWQATQPASDAGPAQAVTRTPFSSNDASVTPVDITAAPGASLKAVAMDIIVSVVTACQVNIITEDGTGFGLHMGANSTVQLSPRGYVKGATNNKKLQITTSVASVVSGVCNWFAEA